MAGKHEYFADGEQFKYDPEKSKELLKQAGYEPGEFKLTMALYEKARGIAKAMGLELPHGSAGGGSDGNFTGAMGIPTLDGLGVRGADMHTLNEHIEIDSLVERGRLMAGLLATLE